MQRSRFSFFLCNILQINVAIIFLQWNSCGIWLIFRFPSHPRNVLFNLHIKEHICWKWGKSYFPTHISRPICCLLHLMLVNQFRQLIEVKRNRQFRGSMKTCTHVTLWCSFIICQISQEHTIFYRLEIKHDEFIHI